MNSVKSIFKYRKEKKEIQNIFDNYGYLPTKISGFGVEFPDNFMMFENWMRLSVRPISLSSYHSLDGRVLRHSALTDIQSIFDREWDRTLKILQSLSISDEEKKEKTNAARCHLTARYLDSMASAYEEALREELEHGLVRIVYLSSVYDKHAKVESRYNKNSFINYSPSIIHVIKPDGKDAVKKISHLFAESYCRPLSCKVMDVYMDRPVQEEEISVIYDMIADVFDILHRYDLKEFLKLKDSDHYQYRNDFNPSFF